MAESPRIGIDLGGTKIEIAVLDAQGAFMLRERCSTPQGDYAAILDAIVALVIQAESRLGLGSLPVGIGIPGSLSPITGHVRNANSLVLNGQPLREHLQERLSRPVFLENDANCLALSEATDGAGKGSQTVFAAILGTGVGAGIVVNGRLLHGRNGVAGEWGHNPLALATSQELARPACWCGRSACLETWLSGPAFSADHLQASGERLSAAAVMAAMRQGEIQATASFRRYCVRLARSLAQVINLLDPDVIVLGGGMSNVPELYEAVPKLWGEFVFSDQLLTVLRPAVHGDSSGVRGAAWLSD
ncbi:ROK family protein [Ottowia thiooxydans]|uniref:ROK family protein n=1 Tax=Ottowia thiooxydans TaxID=219182 RepID=UPI0003F6645E|nr:ROK family protein [Ottowia thiooxydans]